MLMRRKHNYGVDGIRVDGAQDFKWWNPELDAMIHDDCTHTSVNFMEETTEPVFVV